MHANTPTIAVHDPRGLPVRTVQYWRQASEELLDVRVTHQQYDAAGRPLGSRDPRLFNLALTGDEGGPFNFTQRYSLSGSVLLTESVDAGWRVALSGEAGQALEAWDGSDGHALMEYDVLLRPHAVLEQVAGGAVQVSERFTYADADTQAAGHNLCGQLVRHDDTAGTCRFQAFSMGGAIQQQARWFLNSIEPADWPATEIERDELLEAGAGAVTMAELNSLGEALSQTDAAGNIQRFSSTVAGELRQASVQLAGQVEQVLVSNLRYDALGNTQSETAGNGVVTARYYDPASGQLQRISARKRDDTVLQDLSYRYDPAGNILRIEDAAQTTKYFRNQVIEPVNAYVYDTLYQLIQATGYEAITPAVGPGLPLFQSPGIDPGQLANYSQRYAYDAAGNLQTLVHVGGQNYTREMVTARYSNRSLPVVNGHRPDEAELAAGFDANGNLRALQPGQALVWDQRSQLRQVTPVVRDDGEDDYERYLYDGGGQRVRKVRMTQASSVSHRAEVRYLPGLEIRTNTATGETLHVISVSACRVLHWVAGKPEEVANDQLRYSLADHLGSSTTELDGQGNVISQESYYPFGGTACWAGRNAVEASYKTIRYSGKELDASGLYYYGFRYYAPWLARWINPDPAGAVDGLNLYEMVGNQPVNHVDLQGHVKKDMTVLNMEKLARSTALRVFGNASALTPEGLDIRKDNAFKEMQGKMRKYDWDREQHAQTLWDMAKSNYFESAERDLRVMLAAENRAIEARATVLPTLSDNQKKGLHLFWSTNAGARFINGIARGGVPKQTVAQAGNSALGELMRGGGEHTVGLSADSKKNVVEPALKLLGDYQAHPQQIVRMLGQSLGKRMDAPLYRGARLPKQVALTLKQSLTTGGFTAFTPDKSTAIEFTGSAYHEADFLASTQAVVFELGEGGAKEILGRKEQEGLFPPGAGFVVTSVKQERSYLRVGLRSSKPVAGAMLI